MKTLFDLAKKAVLPGLAILGVGYAIYYSLYARDALPAADARPSISAPGSAPEAGGRLAGAGIVEPAERTVKVAPEVQGVVKRVIGQDRVGGLVKKGEILLELDGTEYEALLNVQKAQLESAKADLQRKEKAPRAEDLPPLEAKVLEAENSYKEKSRRYERAKPLIEKKTMSQEEVEDRYFAYKLAEAQLKLAQADLERMKKGTWAEDLNVAKAAVKLAEAQVAQAQTKLDQLVVTCESDLTLLNVDVRPQEFVGLPPKVIMELGDTKNMNVRVYIDEHDASRFRPGAKAIGNLQVGRQLVEIPLLYVRHEPIIIPKPTLTGEQTERVDVRVLQLVYKFANEQDQAKVFVGQQLDVYILEQ